MKAVGGPTFNAKRIVIDCRGCSVCGEFCERTCSLLMGPDDK